MFRIRPYRKNDAQEIVKWCMDETSFYKWSAGIMGSFPLTPERLEEALCGRIDNDRYFPFVAVDDGAVVGFFILCQPGDCDEELRFGFVIVSPQIRGKSYGKKMLELGKKFAFEIYGAKKLGLFGLWAVVLKETGEFIGDCGITIQNIDGELLPEIGYHIHKKYWRRGFAKEASRAVRDWVFTNTEYNEIYSYMKYTNVGSYSTALANGMRRDFQKE